MHKGQGGWLAPELFLERKFVTHQTPMFFQLAPLPLFHLLLCVCTASTALLIMPCVLS